MVQMVNTSLSVFTGYNFRLSVSDIVMFEERDHFPSSGGRGYTEEVVLIEHCVEYSFQSCH